MQCAGIGDAIPDGKAGEILAKLFDRLDDLDAENGSRGWCRARTRATKPIRAINGCCGS